MAVDTPSDVRSLVIYQVFPRNYGPTGTLRDITADLDRIVDLGADVLFLMPIHPIGVEGRKGSQGSPYAISDYRALHPDLGTDEDFDALVSAAHDAGLRVIIDVVFNHTSPDSVLVAEHPEFFHRDADGRPFPHGARVARHRRPQAPGPRPGSLPDRLPGPLGTTGRGRVPVRRRLAGARRVLAPGPQRAGSAQARPAVARGVREPGLGVADAVRWGCRRRRTASCSRPSTSPTSTTCSRSGRPRSTVRSAWAGSWRCCAGSTARGAPTTRSSASWRTTTSTASCTSRRAGRRRWPGRRSWRARRDR